MLFMRHIPMPHPSGAMRANRLSCRFVAAHETPKVRAQIYTLFNIGDYLHDFISVDPPETA